MDPHKDFLDRIELRLRAFHDAVLQPSVEDLLQLRAEVRRWLGELTHSDRPDFGKEQNKLLFPGWEEEWDRHDEWSCAVSPKRLYELLPGDRQDDEDLRTRFYDAFRQLVRFVLDGKSDYLRQEITADLRRALGVYLSLRGHAVAPSSAPPAAMREQGEGNGGEIRSWRKSNNAALAKLEKETPAFTRGKGQWVTCRKAAELEGLEVSTLSKYRKTGLRNADNTLGRDRDGRVWRRIGTPRSHPWYLRVSLRASPK